MPTKQRLKEIREHAQQLADLAKTQKERTNKLVVVLEKEQQGESITLDMVLIDEHMARISEDLAELHKKIITIQSKERKKSTKNKD